MTKVFIDGSAGTTGLRIADRLGTRMDLQLISIPEEFRKDVAARREAFQQADIIFLCLPDQAAIEAVELAKDCNAKIIDTSTAHRVKEGWTYGFPELKGQREKIMKSTRIANPGCHASGFVALVAPLVEAGLLHKDVMLTSFSLTGYSGGGKKMIGEYEGEHRNVLLDAPRQYALSQQHKHLKEIVKVCGLTNTPVFCPIVGDFYSGMEVTVPIFAKDLNGSMDDVKELYQQYYKKGLIHYAAEGDADGLLSAGAFSGRDDMQISVFGNEERILLTSRFDNLGKGASGAAIQNMNILLGLEETTALSF